MSDEISPRQLERARDIALEAKLGDKAGAVFETIVADMGIPMSMFRTLNVDATHKLKLGMFQGIAASLAQRCPELIRTSVEGDSVLYQLVLTFERP